MRQYILRRVLMLIPVLFLITVLVFIFMRILPGDVAVLKLGEHANEEDLRAFRDQLGLNEPLLKQYFLWIGDIFRGDLGVSLWTDKSCRSEVLHRMPVSIQLGIMAVIFELCIAIPIGVIVAIRQNSIIDYTGRFVAILGLAVPGFWLATLLITYGSIWLGWSPALRYHEFIDGPWTNLRQFFWPAVLTGLASAAVTMRMTRSTLLEVLRQDYIRTAWSKGLLERVVIYRHALKNALIPIVTMVGNTLGFLLGGEVIMEQIFNLPGLGRLTWESVMQRDYPQIQANVLVIATTFVLVNLLVDITYAFLDPRIKYR